MEHRRFLTDVLALVHRFSLHDWLQIIGLLVTVGMLWLTLRQLKLMRIQIEATNRKDGIDRALAFALVNCPHLATILGHLEKVFPPNRWAGRTIPLENLRLELQAGRVNYTELTELLRHWENLALTIAVGCTNEDVAFDVSGDDVVEHVTLLGAFIDMEDRIRGREVYPYLTRLGRQWSLRVKRARTRPAFRRNTWF